MVLRLVWKHAMVLEILMMNNLEISSFDSVEKLLCFIDKKNQFKINILSNYFIKINIYKFCKVDSINL